MAAHLTSMTIYLHSLKNQLKDSKHKDILLIQGAAWAKSEVTLMKKTVNQLSVSLTAGMRTNERVIAAINELKEAINKGGAEGEHYATDAFNRNLETSIEKLEASILKFSQESSTTTGLSAPPRVAAKASESKVEHEQKEDTRSIELFMGTLSKEPYTHESELFTLNDEDENEIDIDDNFEKRLNDMVDGEFVIITAGEDFRAKEPNLIGFLASKKNGNELIYVKDGALWVKGKDSENGPYKNFDSLYEGMNLDRSKGLKNSKASPAAKELESLGVLKVAAKMTSEREMSLESSTTAGSSAPPRGGAKASESKVEHEQKEDTRSIELFMGTLSKEPYTHESEIVKLNDEGEINIDDDFLKRLNDMGDGAFAIITAGEDFRAQESDLIGLFCSQDKGNRQIHVKDGALWVRSEGSENGPYKNFDSLYEGMNLDRSKGLKNSKASPAAKELESVGELKVSAEMTLITRTGRERPFKSAFGSNTTERRDNFLSVLKEYDKSDSYVSDNRAGYLFYEPGTSTYFANKQTIEVKGPFFNKELGAETHGLQRLCFSADKEEREMAQKIVASEYKIHLMPKTEYTMYVIKKLLKLFDGDPELRKLIMTFKVFDSSLTTTMGLTPFGIQIMPRVVIYPILGKENAEKLLHAIYNSFTPEEMLEIGLGITPRYNTLVSALIFYSQGGGDFKGKTLLDIGKENKARLITDTGAHFVWGERLFKPGPRSAPMLAEGSLPAVESKVEREHKLLSEAELATVEADISRKAADGSRRDKYLSDTALSILDAILKFLPEKDQRWIETKITTKHEKLTMREIVSVEINAMIRELVSDRNITDLTLKTIETLKQFRDPEKQKQFIDDFIKRLQLIKAYDAQEKPARQVENAPAAAPGVPESKPTSAAAKAIEDTRAARKAVDNGRAGDDTEEPGSTPAAGL